MDSGVPFAVWSRERQQRIEDVLAAKLSSDAMPAPVRLTGAMRYANAGHDMAFAKAVSAH